MKMWKCSILFGAAMILILSSLTGSAAELTDGTGDVYHHKWSQNQWTWTASTVDKPNIDITKVSYSVSDDTLTATMEVNGEIESSTKIAYFLYFNTTDAIYMLSYVNGQGAALGMSIGGDINMSYGEVIATGNTMTATIDLLGDNTAEDFWGVAAEYSADYTTIENTEELEWWGDWVPGTYAPWYASGNGDGDGTGDGGDGDGTGNGGDGDTDGGTPGFETLAVIAALAIACILLRRKK